MTLLDPALLEIGLGITALLLLGVWRHSRRRRRLAEFLGGRRAAERVSRSNLYRVRVERMGLLGLGGLAVALASAEPRLPTPAPEEPPPPRSVVIAIDVSASMQANDVAPTRLAQSVDVARDLIDALGEDRVGLLLFAGTAYPLAPPTYDHDALRFLLGGVSSTIASALDPGTLVSVGISEASALVERPVGADAGGEGLSEVPITAEPLPEIQGERELVIIGDGESGEPEEDLATAVAAAREDGISIYTVGVGTPGGSGMTMPEGRYQLGGPILDDTGARGVSRLRESVLRQVAEQGGGRYALASDEGAFAALRTELAEPVRPRDEASSSRSFWTDHDLVPILGAVALLLLVLESLLDVSTSRVKPPRLRGGTA